MIAIFLIACVNGYLSGLLRFPLLRSYHTPRADGLTISSDTGNGQEQRVDELEALLRGPIQRRKVVYLPGVVESYLRDLKGSLETDPDAARRLMARLIGPIKLVRQGRRVLAEVRGNLLGILGNEGDWLETVVPEEGLEPPRA